MNSPAAGTQRSARLTFLAVVAAFILPILIAWLMTSGLLPWIPRARVNYGTLIEPPVDLKPAAAAEANTSSQFDQPFGQWTLAVIPSTPCEQTCRQTLDHMRRIRLAINDPSDRLHVAAVVDRADLQPDLSAANADPQLKVFSTDKRGLMNLLRANNTLAGTSSIEDRMIVVDYASRAMMIYPVDAEMAGIARDLKRLLRASKTN